MASYNKINGTYATEHTRYIEDMLYKEWGYTGFVVSDWGAVHDRVETAKGGTALTMPSDTANDQIIRSDKVRGIRQGSARQSFHVTYRAGDNRTERNVGGQEHIPIEIR
ncbi:glycoside hydrolase family 3 N-terminal domain-containing protein [Paenibacillus illinoisensis]|uniref:glycoside hydrolase family 3 N-terminal domain-containing protein n=1 Tax=Paenibacillus illinoisensis TaxID=59845 RepID=UPI001C8EFEEB|nr:glycoside hydrolase family 3 N-terminal domain-containing protein [Paenibacillus illinoisensis]MBY0217813.1 hypothetical protein [Paenibacillus illinoisensis]